jgi:putative transcriptional regulator
MVAAKRRVDGGILASVSKTATGLHKAGLVDKATMREFDPLYLTPIETLTAE